MELWATLDIGEWEVLSEKVTFTKTTSEPCTKQPQNQPQISSETKVTIL